MASPHAEATKVINARPEVIYGILSDYHTGHPKVLPKPYFESLEVEKGGVGDGTIIRVGMKVLGASQTLRMHVTEPEPGRVLREEDRDNGVVTHFTVNPLDGGTRSEVTIATDWKAKPGIGGFIEGIITPMVARRLYKQELDLIDAEATRRPR